MVNGLLTAGQYRATSNPWKRDIFKRPESVEETPSWSFDEYFKLIQKSLGGYQGLDKLSQPEYNRRILENLFFNMHGVDRRNLDEYSDAELRKRAMVSSILGPGGSLVNLYNLFPSLTDAASTDQRSMLAPLKLALQLRSGNIPGAGKTAQNMWQDIRKSPGKIGRGLFPVRQLVPRGAGLVRAGGASGLFGGLGSPAHLPVVNPFSVGRPPDERRNIYTGELEKQEHLLTPRGKRAGMKDLVANWSGMLKFVDRELVNNFFPRVKSDWQYSVPNIVSLEKEYFKKTGINLHVSNVASEERFIAQKKSLLEKAFGHSRTERGRGDIDVKEFWKNYTSSIYQDNPNERKSFEANLKMMLEKYPEVSPAHVAALEHVMWGRPIKGDMRVKGFENLHLSEIVSAIYQLALGKMPAGDGSQTDRLKQLVFSSSSQYKYDKQSRPDLVYKGKFDIDQLKEYEYDESRNNYLPSKEWVNAAKVVVEKLQNLTKQTLLKKLGTTQSKVLPEIITFYRGAKKSTRTGRIGDLTPVAFTQSGSFLGEWKGGFDVPTKELGKKYKGVSKFPIDISMMRWMIAHDESEDIRGLYLHPQDSHAWISEEEFLIHKNVLGKSEQYRIVESSLAEKSLRPGLLTYLKMQKGGVGEILRDGKIVRETSLTNPKTDLDVKEINFDKLDESEKHLLDTFGTNSFILDIKGWETPIEITPPNIQLALLKEKILTLSDAGNTEELVKQVMDMPGGLTGAKWDRFISQVSESGGPGTFGYVNWKYFINPFNYSETKLNRMLNLQSPFSSFPGIQQITKENEAIQSQTDPELRKLPILFRSAITGYDPSIDITQQLFENFNLMQNQTQFFSDALRTSGLSKFLQETDGSGKYSILTRAIQNIVKEAKGINTIAERMEFYDITEERNWLQKNTGMVKKLSSFEERSGSPELIRKMQYIINDKFFRLLADSGSAKFNYMTRSSPSNLINKLFGDFKPIKEGGKDFVSKSDPPGYVYPPEARRKQEIATSIQLWKSITETPEAKKIITMYQQGLKNYEASIEQANITGNSQHKLESWIRLKSKDIGYYKRNLTEETLQNLLSVKERIAHFSMYSLTKEQSIKNILDKAVILYTWTQPEHFFADPENVKSFVKRTILNAKASGKDIGYYKSNISHYVRPLIQHAMKTKVMEVNYYQRDREEATLKNLYQYFTTGGHHLDNETKKIAAEKMYRILVKHFLQKRQSVSKSQETGEYKDIATEKGSIPLYNLKLGLQHVGGRSMKETLKSMREKLRKD